MAWSQGSARSSGSKRQARARFTTTVFGIAALFAGIALFIMSEAAPDRFDALRGLVLDALAPVGAALQWPVHTVATLADTVGDHLGTVDRLRVLEAENARLRREAGLAGALREENTRLKRVVRLVEPARRPVAVARIVGGSAAIPSGTAIISAGRSNGVEIGQPVFNDDGLVGRVVETGVTASRVILVSDAASRIPVRVVRTGVPALLSGVGGGRAELDFATLADFRGAVAVGDRLVTSGEGGVFPPGVPVADVTDLGVNQVIAQPIAAPTALGMVSVERIWLPPPTGSVGGPPPPDQLAAEEAARQAAAKAAADRVAAEAQAQAQAQAAEGATAAGQSAPLQATAIDAASAAPQPDGQALPR